MEFEAVERKGLGHPDTLADMLAEEFSARYSCYGLDAYGFVPNHWVDKVALIGAASSVEFGQFEIIKPITANLFGKVTSAIGITSLPIEELFAESARKILCSSTRRSDIIDHLRLAVENTEGVAPDHPTAFYRPRTPVECQALLVDRRSNDTAVCSAFAPRTGVETLVMDLEIHLTSERLMTEFPMIGSDVKVLGLRTGKDLDITVCLPFHPDQAPTRRSYETCLEMAREEIRRFVRARMEGWPRVGCLTVNVNTKDQTGGAYLAPFGTSLGKGDCGLVGRGNRYQGIIATMRSSSVEAFAGKNPLHHVGKLYTLAAVRIAESIHAELGLSNETILVARNGDLLDDPLFAGVRLTGQATAEERTAIVNICEEAINNIGLLSKWLLATPVLDRFRYPTAFPAG